MCAYVNQQRIKAVRNHVDCTHGSLLIGSLDESRISKNSMECRCFQPSIWNPSGTSSEDEPKADVVPQFVSEVRGVKRDAILVPTKEEGVTVLSSGEGRKLIPQDL